MAKRTSPEASVQKAVMDILAAERIFAIRINTGAFRNAKGRPIFMHSGGPGVADVLAFPRIPFYTPDRPYRYTVPTWIECKSTLGRQSPEQHSFEERVVREGHFYLIVRSPEDLLTWLKEHGF